MYSTARYKHSLGAEGHATECTIGEDVVDPAHALYVYEWHPRAPPMPPPPPTPMPPRPPIPPTPPRWLPSESPSP
ncbi:hypothetical protein HYPSUDRAFT_36346 [Hypholoma sublateritium FD-334 SS-4]|uniref:Uncharacterized protein n=1 Tax=Hypholoma sublateritium (strain FD-334 SS-4) TaxID=945553 RepID=A0A0D2P6T0_HYPSF|nr:hypothetical protein HYPSUDRAFT_36346 [Hypholoma sublateritium FD-334 SS-4]